MSYLNINTSVNSNFSSDSKIKPSIFNPKSNFTKKYEELYRQITDSCVCSNNEQNCFIDSPRLKGRHLDSFTESLEKKKKENSINQAIFKTKMMLLTGKEIEHNNVKSQPIPTVNQPNITKTKNLKLNNNYKELRNYLKRKNDNNLTSKIFANKKGNNVISNDLKNKTNSNNCFIQKIKNTFPEYVNVKTKGRSFIMNGDTKMHKIISLKNHIENI